MSAAADEDIGAAEVRTEVPVAATAAATGAMRTGTAEKNGATDALWTTPLTRIDLSRHQICDDGAVALALALRQNVRVEVSKGTRN